MRRHGHKSVAERRKNMVTDLATFLWKYRKKNNLNQTEFAKEMGVSRQTIVAWESGKVTPRKRRLKKINELLGDETSCIIAETAEQPSTMEKK